MIPLQYIWESDASTFSVVEDPRGDTLKRGTAITLVLKEEAYDYLEQDSIKDLVKKYSQFINFNIYMWTSKTEQVDEPIDDEDEEPAADEEEEKKEEEDEDAAVEEEKEEEEKKPKTKKVSKTTWDWELVNGNKPVWTRDGFINQAYPFLLTDFGLILTGFTAEFWPKLQNCYPKPNPTESKSAKLQT